MLNSETLKSVMFFTFSCAIDSVDRNEQLAGKDWRRVTEAGSEGFLLAAVPKRVQRGDVRLVIDRSLPDRSLPDRNQASTCLVLGPR